MEMKLKVSGAFDDGKRAEQVVVVAIASAQRTTTQTKGAQTKARGVKGRPLPHTLPAALARTLERFDSELSRKVAAYAKRYELPIAAGKRFELPSELVPVLRDLRISIVSERATAAASHLDEWRKLGGDAVVAARRKRAPRLAIYLPPIDAELEPAAIEALTEGVLLGSYDFPKFKGAAKRKAAEASARFPSEVVFVSAKSARKGLAQAVQRAKVTADAVAHARNLVNTPPADLTPRDLVREAQAVKKIRGGKIALKVYGRQQLKRLGANAILTVGKGSSLEPYLIHLSYVPTTKTRSRKCVVLVGKGVTYDSGGLCIKTQKGMEDMKCDMAGAACVLSVMRAIAQLPAKERPTHEVHALIPTVENMINGVAMRPGDVIKTLAGITVEVLNTDAEGRLILADALTYASRLNPDVVVDYATLTGACVVALGSEYAGLFSDSKELIDRLDAASEAAGEKLWRLPLAKEYRDQLECDIADLRNIGSGGPGAILAALFLKEFAPKGADWAHIDIAGPAYVTRGNEYTRRGGTGFGVRTTLSMLGTL